MPVLTYKLLKMVTGHPCYEMLLYSQPRLPCRIHRPYLSNKMSRRENVRILMYHYEKVTTFLGKERFLAHLSPSGIRLAYITGKNDELFRLSMKSTHKLDREGELSVILSDSRGTMLAEITLTFCQRFEEDCLIIGGLQGPNTPDALTVIRHATKQLHGIFPKKVVLEAVLLIGQFFQVKRAYAVTNSNHVYQSLRYTNRQKQIVADYDAFWEASGGTRTRDNYYQLPPVLKRKNLEDVPSKKRSEYRKRFELLDEVNRELTVSLMSSINHFTAESIPEGNIAL